MSSSRYSRTRRIVPALIIAGIALSTGGVGVAYAADTTVGTLAVSFSPDRSDPHNLQSAQLQGDVYIFVNKDRINQVSFFLDDSGQAGEPYSVESSSPFDFAGTLADGSARRFDTTKLADGDHTVTAVVRSSYRTRTYNARFEIDNSDNPPPVSTSSTSQASTSTPTSATRSSATPTSSSATPSSSSAAPSSSTPATATQTTSSPQTGGKPDASTSGLPKGTQLTVVNGNQTFTTSGQTISGLDVHGSVTIRGTNITLKNSIIRGPSTGGCTNGAALDVSGSNVVVQDSEIAVSTPTACLDGVWADNATLTRLNVHGGVDGLKLSTGATLQASWIHDLSWFASDPNQGGGETHNDAVQILDGSNITLKSNNLDATGDGTNAAAQITQDFGPVTNLNITGNWMDGGGCSLNISHKGGTSLSVSASGNRFGRNSFYNCPILLSTKTTLTGSGNVWDDTGASVPIQRHD